MEEIIKPNFVELKDLSKLRTHKLIYQNNSNYKFYINKKGDLCRKKLNPIFNIYTLITVLIILAGFSYYNDIKVSRYFVNNLDSVCVQRMNDLSKNESSSLNSNLSNLSSLIIPNVTR